VRVPRRAKIFSSVEYWWTAATAAKYTRVCHAIAGLGQAKCRRREGATKNLASTLASIQFTCNGQSLQCLCWGGREIDDLGLPKQECLQLLVWWQLLIVIRSVLCAFDIQLQTRLSSLPPVHWLFGSLRHR